MSIKVAIVGVGNCASSLVQGVQFYRGAVSPMPGLPRPRLGAYGIGDIEFAAAFDVAKGKVGLDLSAAILAPPNNTRVFAEVPPLGVVVQRGPTGDGLGQRLREIVTEETEHSSASVVSVLRSSGAQVMVSYLPVGSEDISRWYAEQALAAGCAYVNCIPVFLSKDAELMARFKAAGLPLLGDDVKSQLGATILHRSLAELCQRRGIRIDRTYQLNFGGNADFANLLEEGRLSSKRRSKTEAVTSLVPGLGGDDVHIGPSDLVPWLQDRKWAYIRLEGTTFGDTPINMEVKLEVWDSPNSAGVVVDLIRCAKIALDRGQGGALQAPSAYYMKAPPMPCDDETALRLLEEFIAQ